MLLVLHLQWLIYHLLVCFTIPYTRLSACAFWVSMDTLRALSVSWVTVTVSKSKSQWGQQIGNKMILSNVDRFGSKTWSMEIIVSIKTCSEQGDLLTHNLPSEFLQQCALACVGGRLFPSARSLPTAELAARLFYKLLEPTRAQQILLFFYELAFLLMRVSSRRGQFFPVCQGTLVLLLPKVRS